MNSFLNSVLSSIGGNGTPISTPPPAAARPQNADAGQGSYQTQDGPLPTRTGTPQNNKRKAEDELVRPTDRQVKNGIKGAKDSRATPPTDPRTSRPANPSSALSSKSTVPYRGTSRPNPAPAAPVAPIPPTAGAVKAPKKGSYAEIMARAKATQSKAPIVGIISHKPKEQMAMSYKKELKMKKKAIRNKKLGIKDGDRPSSSGSMSSSPATGAPDRRKVPQPAYKGTAKPRPQPTYKGTMKSASITQKVISRGGDGKNSRPRYDEYAATDEDDLDDVKEDDYGSDESDDMEAGFSDVEHEESIAARAARKEDEEEAKLEAKLKSEKEERKKRLAEMAKKAKPQRY
ncbi:hypothetical protein ABVK25_001300 [Lepraria finkii]|uniref:Uncharacterized protein n=1 Tax=Lepraria finkii TaxID=1340010 RepID=A0ABR4BL95_9LECA